MASPGLAVDHEARRRAMDRAGAGASRGLLCPECATELPDFRGEDRPPEVVRCRRCGNMVRADDHGPGDGHEGHGAAPRLRPLGGLSLAWRNGVLRLIEHLYWAGTFAG